MALIGEFPSSKPLEEDDVSYSSQSRVPFKQSSHEQKRKILRTHFFTLCARTLESKPASASDINTLCWSFCIPAEGTCVANVLYVQHAREVFLDLSYFASLVAFTLTDAIFEVTSSAKQNYTVTVSSLGTYQLQWIWIRLRRNPTCNHNLPPMMPALTIHITAAKDLTLMERQMKLYLQ
eukprot:scaffold8156_cov101-Cylindrotheca_fusiformis.AAC.5